LLALASFIASFAIARGFVALRSTTVISIRGLHVHHFFFGIALLAIGGWLGISSDSERMNRLAAILYGAGGGLIGDEIGLLLTFKSYWTQITYTFVIAFLAIVSILILTIRYSRTVKREFAEFLRSNASLYISVFLEVVSIEFLIETDNITIDVVAGALAVFAFIIIVAYSIQRFRMKRRTKKLQTEKV
jgi:hypothetical protein